jgi:hypothetical protein
MRSAAIRKAAIIEADLVCTKANIPTYSRLLVSMESLAEELQREQEGKPNKVEMWRADCVELLSAALRG